MADVGVDLHKSYSQVTVLDAWFVDWVESQGHQVVMSSPDETKAIAQARLKEGRMIGSTRRSWRYRCEAVSCPRRALRRRR